MFFPDHFDWDKYLKETGSVSAPSEYFRQSLTPPTNEFQVGMKLEARDPRNIGSVCVASVIATTGARLRLRLDGSDNKNDFWRLVDSSDIQPVGTCEQEGDLLQPPLGYRMNVSSWPMFLLRTLTGSELAPAVFFKKEPPSPPLNNFKVGMKIEAVDRKNPFLICPATIGGVKGDQIHITFDGWSGTFDYWCKYDSRDIFPVGWCCLTGDVLQPPGSSAEKKSKSRGATRPWKYGATALESEEASIMYYSFKCIPFFLFILYLNKVWKKPKGRGFTKPGNSEVRLGKSNQPAPDGKKPKGRGLRKPWEDEAKPGKGVQTAPAEKKRKGKTVTKPWKDQAGFIEDAEAGPGDFFCFLFVCIDSLDIYTEKKRKGKTVTKPWKDQAGFFEDAETGPGDFFCFLFVCIDSLDIYAEKKRKGKTVTKPWKDQTGFFEDAESGSGDFFCFLDSPDFFVCIDSLDIYGILINAEKKRKGKTVTKPWKDQTGFFEDVEAGPALFSALSMKSTENTPPSSSEQPKSSTSEKTKSSTSKGAQSSKKSPRKTTIVLPAAKTSKKSGQPKPTGDTSAPKKRMEVKIVFPKKKGGKKEKCIPVVSSTSSASLSSLMRSSSSDNSSVVPSKIVMSTVCVYINKHGDCGPYLDPQKVRQLPDHFGPGPVNVILQRTVQACVDCAIDTKTVFLLLKPDNRGGEIITAFFDAKVHTVQLPPVNSASFVLRFLENFCHSLQCDKFLSSQPFKPRVRIHTPATDLDQNKPGEELKERRSLKRFSQRPLPASSKVPRKTGRASKASSYIAVPDPSVLKQGFCKDPSTWSVDEVIQFMKHTDPHISGPLADIFRQHVTYFLIRFSCCPNAFE
uniref:Scm polycomb group protein like 2 n=1 Tax=Cricetulus griseus TaxID=10029 RepID=A0A8C2MG68_CRIGR